MLLTIVYVAAALILATVAIKAAKLVLRILATAAIAIALLLLASHHGWLPGSTLPSGDTTSTTGAVTHA